MSLTFHRLDELPPPKARDEIVHGLLAAGEICVLSGAPGCGKSAVAATLVGAVAEGDPFLGLSTEQGCVAYLALEKPALAFRRLAATGCRQDRIAVGNGAVSFADSGSVDLLIKGLKAIECKLPETLALIVLDCLGRAMTSMDENSSRDAGVAVAELDKIGKAFPGAALVAIHHVGKGEHQSLRGSSALLAGADLELTVETKNRRRALRVRKANGIPDGQTFPFQLVPVGTPSGEVVLAEADTGSAPLEALGPTSNSTIQKLLTLVPDDEILRLDLREAASKAGLLGPTASNYGERLRQLLVDAKSLSGLIAVEGKEVRKTQAPQITPNLAQAFGE